MNDQPIRTDQRDPKPWGAAIWLLCALLPAVVMMACLPIRGKRLPQFLLFLTGVCSIASSIGLVRPMKNVIAQVLLAMLLAVLFFIVNCLMALYVGCTAR